MRCAITRAIRATEKSAFAGGGQSRVLGDSVADLASPHLTFPNQGTSGALPVHDPFGHKNEPIQYRHLHWRTIKLRLQIT
jgi:hypothetical protein